MDIGIVGLGRMGANIVRRLLAGGHRVVAHDIDPRPVQRLQNAGAVAAADLEAVVAELPRPRVIWIMLPAGEPTETAVARLGELLDADDIVIDGGNSHWKDDLRRAAALAGRGIRYLDIGTSGGVWGLERGYCLMIGGPEPAFRHIEPVLACLAPGPGALPRTPRRTGAPAPAEHGYARTGGTGSGHFVKMVHNGIEYGVMQAFAEGFEVLRQANSEALPEGERLDLDLADVAEVWRRGSVLSSWLLDLIATSLVEDPGLDGYEGRVQDSGEGRWFLLAAMEEAVPAHVISAALYARFRSRQPESFADKMLSAMRKQFGGHVEKHP